MSERLQRVLVHIATGAGVGAGATAMLMLAHSLSSRPEELFALLRGYGPWFLLAVGGLVFVDRRVGEGIRVLKDNSQSQQRLADAVQHLAEKDDRSAEKQERMLGYVGTQMEKILEHFESAKDGRAKGASA